MNALTTQVISRDEIKQALPRGVSINITDSMLSHINNLMQDSELESGDFHNGLLNYASVLKQGKFKTESYVNAVQYASYKLLGHSNEVAYSKVFPSKYQSLLNNPKTAGSISAYVGAYHNSKLVGLIIAQTLTPAWVHNQGAYQEAINTQLMLIRDDDVSDKVRCEAANSLLTHLKQPEIGKVELDVTVGGSNVMDSLKGAMRELAEEQKLAIERNTAKVEEIAGTRIIPKDTDISVKPSS